MSEIKNYTVDGRDFTFYCESHNTRNGFAHTCEVFEDNYKIGGAKINYLNRTWESYRYQSAMCNALESRIDGIKYHLKNDFMNKNGYAKMTSKRKEEFEKIVNEDKDIKVYNDLMAFIKTSAPYWVNSYDEWVNDGKKTNYHM